MNHDEPNQQPRVVPLGSVPVFNCHVYVGPAVEGTGYAARAANLPDLAAHGRTEREALQLLITQIKQLLAEHHAAGTSAAWLDPPLPPAAGEQQRFVPVHL